VLCGFLGAGRVGKLTERPAALLRPSHTKATQHCGQVPTPNLPHTA
jgi:hypothetical protein